MEIGKKKKKWEGTKMLKANAARVSRIKWLQAGLLVPFDLCKPYWVRAGPSNGHETAIFLR